MSTLTAILGLSKPGGTDTLGAAVTQYNANMDIIDTELNNRVSKGSPITNLIATTAVAGSVPLVAKGILAQSANLFEARNNVDTPLAYIANNGSIFGSDIHGQAGYFAGDLTFPYQGARLQVQPVNAGEIGLIVKGYASQTGSLQEWRNSSGSPLATIDSNGKVNAAQGMTVTGRANDNSIFLQHGASNQVGVIMRGASGQSSNLHEWQDSSGSTLTRVYNDGSFGVGPNAAVNLIANAASQLANGYIARFDSQHASALVVRVRGAVSQANNLQEWQNSSGGLIFAINSARPSFIDRTFAGSGRSGGSAQALPSNPVGYFVVNDSDGNVRYLPYYA